MRKLILGLVSAAALSLTALPAMAQHHHHHFRGFGFGFSPFLLAPYATPFLFGGAPYGYGAGCGAGYGAYGAGYGAYGAVAPPCAQGLYGYGYPYGFVGPRHFHHRPPSVNTK